ncbi:DNA polymerase III subunit gamma/tau [bacterium]|nr:DNA polymerase III subunit gamma/tau [bacterium]
MAYQVVARKWRPQRFDEVVGQDHVTSTLKYAILNKRTAPVYLFTGIRGTGKTTLARIFVKALNCTDLQPDGEPCNKCECCREIAEGRSPDVVEIDGASNNSVDDVRDIKENISYSPVKSRFKVYIIDEVHMLSKSAFNALLKTLEEPPAHSIFILATTDPQKIPTTVLSRCQRYDLKRLSLDDVAHQLEKILKAEQKEYDMEALYAIAREGEGSMRDSQTILEQLVTFGGGKVTETEISMILGASDKKQLRGIIESIAKHDSVSAISFARDIYKGGKSVEKAARDILSLLHNILLFSELGNTGFIEAPAEELEWIKSCSNLASTPDWTRLFRFWNGEYDGIKSSDFSLMLFEVAVITACSFPTMSDFRSFVKNISSAAAAMPKNEPVSEKKAAESAAMPQNAVSDGEKTASETAVKPAEAPKAGEKPEEPAAEAPKTEEKPEEPAAEAQKAVEKPEEPAAEAPKAVEKPEEPAAEAPKTAEKPEEPASEAPKTAEKPEEPAAEAPKTAEKRVLWRDFIETFNENEPFLYGKLINLPYSEEGDSVSVTIDSALYYDAEDLAGRVQSAFESFSKGEKRLKIAFEEGNNVSIYTEEERKHIEEVENRKKEMVESAAVKAACDMGFEIKGVSAE